MCASSRSYQLSQSPEAIAARQKAIDDLVVEYAKQREAKDAVEAATEIVTTPVPEPSLV